MNIRFEHSPAEVRQMDTSMLRGAFLVDELVKDNKLALTYTHYDRVIIGGARPIAGKIVLQNHPELRAGYFLERRELGIINVAGSGRVYVNNEPYLLNRLDCLYVGKGNPDIAFESVDAGQPAVFFMLSAPAHVAYPVKFCPKEDAESFSMGSAETSNSRTIYRYIHENGIKSCQLVMGLTILDEGSVWNTMPAHTHTRRMETYFYFDMKEEHRVFHFMGQPGETRHIVTGNYNAVVSPPWSIHSGCGTSNYGFIWGMAGENYTYNDMDAVPVSHMY